MHRPLRIQNGGPVGHRPRQVRIRKGNSAKRGAAQNVARGGFGLCTKEEAGLWAQISMAPPIENDRGDIAARVETRLREHPGELLADAAPVLVDTRAEHFSAPAHSLFG